MTELRLATRPERRGAGRRRGRFPAVQRVLTLALVWPLSMAAQTPTQPQGPRLAFSQLPHAGQVLDVEWQLPALQPGAQTEIEPKNQPGARPWAWLLLQHGFMRRCANLRHTAARLASAGVATLCVNVPDLSGGAPALARVVAQQLLGPQAYAPDGHWRPARVLVGGHSAGALFAAHVGAALQAAEPQALAGALLFDPVGSRALGDALAPIVAQGQRPVLALMAPPLKCNARHLAKPALQRLADEAVGGATPLQAWVWPAGATHVDVEAEDTETVAVWACGDGWPRPAFVEAQRSLSVTWLQAVQQGLAPAAVAEQVQAQVRQLPEPERPRPLLDSAGR